MEAWEKLIQISPYMAYEPSGDIRLETERMLGNRGVFSSGYPGIGVSDNVMPAPAVPETRNHCPDLPIAWVTLPGGKKIPLLKTLLTTVCEKNCYYCCFRQGRDFPRSAFTPDELANTFLRLYHTGRVQGLFLSSGIAGGGVRTQDRLLDTAEILRHKLHFQGYMHLKIMPGAEKGQVVRSMQLADRVSINLEAPNISRLEKLAPRKQFQLELYQSLQWIEEIRKTEPSYRGWKGRWPSSTTQFVVGGVGESDLELLATTAILYQRVGLSRAYFSGFEPIKDTPLEQTPPANPIRQNRLYQASFLLRDYDFELKELPFEKDGFLPLSIDPKLAWAKINLENQPVDINKAEPFELMRIPGVGTKYAQKILKARRYAHLHALSDLKALGLPVGRMAPFILLDGKRPAYQLHF